MAFLGKQATAAFSLDKAHAHDDVIGGALAFTSSVEAKEKAVSA